MVKIHEAQAHISGVAVAKMIMEFQLEFRDTYPLSVHASTLCAVGPLQSMIGLAIKNGHLQFKAEKEKEQCLQLE